jgi:hypothetical protein
MILYSNGFAAPLPQGALLSRFLKSSDYRKFILSRQLPGQIVVTKYRHVPVYR